MIALSRTARISDDIELGVSELIHSYASLPKNFHSKSKPRYKFWDYALALRLIKENDIKEILDVGFTYDTVFETILRNESIGLREVNYKDLPKLPIRNNKYNLVTCFGIMEHVELRRAFFLKLIKHVAIGGCLLLTTDNESAKKNKKRIVTSGDLIDLSIVAENIGYELYNLENGDSIDYIEGKEELMSLVLKRVGR